jgi:hypothetical protein
MRNKILKSVFTIGAVLAMTGVTYTQAAFTDTVLIENNTFTTGNAELKLFYDCYLNPSGANTQDVARTYTGGVLPVGDTGAYVECPADDAIALSGQSAGEWEQAALLYAGATTWFGVPSNNDGATLVADEVFNYEGAGNTGLWTTANGWYDALSSPQDWTNVYPGWNTFVGAGSIEANTEVIAMNEGDFLNIGNAGSVPLSALTLQTVLEASGVSEGVEPLQGLLDVAGPDSIGDTFVGGGDRIDPLSDAGWVTAGKVYDAALANMIYVKVDRMDPSTGTATEIYSGTVAGLTGVTPDVLLGTDGLEPNEVVTLRFNWEMDSDADNTYQDMLFDYRMNFTGTT